MSKGKKPDSPKPKKSQRHHGGNGAISSKSSKQKVGAGAKPHRKAKVKGKTCSDCGGTVASGAEARHGEGKCIPQRWREVVVLPPVASTVEEVPDPTTTVPVSASVVPICGHCKKSVSSGTEGDHFRLKQRVNARPGVMDKKWHCHAPPPPPKPVAPPLKPKTFVGQPPQRPSYWTSSREWTCGNGHGGSYASESFCHKGCGSARPSEASRFL